MRFSILVLAFILVHFNSVANEIDSLKGWERELSKSDFSGSVVIAHAGKIKHQWHFGLSNRKENIAFNQSTVHEIGSITKQFVSVAILKLSEEGKLSLDDKIDKFFKNVPIDKRNITIHHLLTHSSGWQQNFGFIYDELEKNDLINKAFKADLIFLPGNDFLYSNIGYSFLALIIERVTDNGWEEYIHKNILIPSSLSQTGFRLIKRDEKNLAISYGRDPNIIERFLNLKPKSRSIGHSMQHYYDNPGGRWNMEGAGSFLSTIGDMFAWYQVMRGKSLLTDKSWEKILTRHIPMNKKETEFYGYGWGLSDGYKGYKKIWHNGSNGYSLANVNYYPELDLMIFYATNNRDDSPTSRVENLDKIIISSLNK
ncbi:serine hydrolase domain-containing protein [Temperatibacter marinus]|uniref:Serine hydrolase domain-containing protein n=1 Tax=Temperatibacter marinus TaxID=1456591 RepID=A0AA52H8Q1_9PROT|nr:serine hydrolase domain-containing protein [Temperatibacter marinus]WND02346.1 serine hydrolase domain-containing protein [Temperatibacter marinus]